MKLGDTQTVQIHGKTCLLQPIRENGGGSFQWSVPDPQTRTTLASSPSRFMAVALAARAVLATEALT